jgi:hypothetical protein
MDYYCPPDVMVSTEGCMSFFLRQSFILARGID